MEIAKYEKSATQKKCNMKRKQHEEKTTQKSETWRTCNTKKT